MNYRRVAIVDFFRRVLRGVDLLVLLYAPYSGNRLNLAMTRRSVWVELGPGPTRLEWLKRMLFKDVVFIDHKDYGIPSARLVISDISMGVPSYRDVAIKSDCVPESVIYFADHCLEHLPVETILGMLRMCASERYSLLARVPNVRSAVGLNDFQSDSTHVNCFDDRVLADLNEVARIQFFGWNRVWRAWPLFSCFASSERLSSSRELCIRYGN